MRQKQLPLVIVCDMLTYSNFKTKKMYSRFRNGNCSNIVGYTPPTLHKGVRWFVDFTAWDPARDAMRRKRCYIKESLSVPAKKQRASEIIAALTKLLSQGWNPWVTNDESRGFVLFDNCLEHFSEYVERMDRKKDTPRLFFKNQRPQRVHRAANQSHQIRLSIRCHFLHGLHRLDIS